MEITEIRIEKTPYRELLIGRGGGFDLWCGFPLGLSLAPRADVFVAAALVPSMQAATDIIVPAESPLCPILVKNLYKVQEFFLCNQKTFGFNLSPVSIKGGSLSPADSNGKMMSFFSG